MNPVADTGTILEFALIAAVAMTAMSLGVVLLAIFFDMRRTGRRKE